jgi:hypothetical protein
VSALVFTACSALGCNGNVGHFDGPLLDGGPVEGINPDDIGTPCVYDPQTQLNPTNACPRGLSCLISTRDGRFMLPDGYALPFWEDQITQRLANGTEIGQCTLVSTLGQPFSCPAGFTVKSFSNRGDPTSLAPILACLRNCTQASECRRQGDVCDVRFADAPSVCVRGCVSDVPDCIRSANITAKERALSFLSIDDLQGAALCDTATGICDAQFDHGNAKPGELCQSSLDCAVGSTCWQPETFGQTTGFGFCGVACKPDAENIQGTCTAPGFICQAGFTRGFGNPFGAPDDGVGFLAADFDVDPPELFEGGGFCFAQCNVEADCGTFLDTQCGQSNDAIMELPWNGQTMCLPDVLRL